MGASAAAVAGTTTTNSDENDHDRPQQQQQQSTMDDTSDNVSNHVQQEIPFLVTHWLANYGTVQNDNNNGNNNNKSSSEQERQEALVRIRRATSEIASAFATIGAYGTTYRVSSLLEDGDIF